MHTDTPNEAQWAIRRAAAYHAAAVSERFDLALELHALEYTQPCVGYKPHTAAVDSQTAVLSVIHSAS